MKMRWNEGGKEPFALGILAIEAGRWNNRYD